MDNNNPKNNKTPLIIASLAAALIAIVSMTLYMKGRRDAQEEQTSTEKTLDGSDQSKSHAPKGSKQAGMEATAPGSSSGSVAVAPGIPEPDCKLVHMKVMDGSKGTFRKNLLTLSESVINPKTLCVKVDGTPVKFSLYQKKANQILIGGVRGSKADISVRFCRDKQRCKEDCKIPRDEFMDALGASDDSESAARWDDGKESDTEKQVAKQMSVFKEDIKAIEAKAMAQMSKWDAKDSQATCDKDNVAQK